MVAILEVFVQAHEAFPGTDWTVQWPRSSAISKRREKQFCMLISENMECFQILHFQAEAVQNVEAGTIQNMEAAPSLNLQSTKYTETDKTRMRACGNMMM